MFVNLDWLCLLALAVLAVPVSTHAAARETTFYVAPNGDDANPGSRRKPFATLERARETVRRAGIDRRRTVVVRGGTYEIRSTFTLGAEDSGTEANPVLWRAAPGETVRLVGGRAVPASAFRPVEDAAILARLEPDARDHVLRADLNRLGIPTPAPFPVTYHGAPPGPELFCNDRRMTLARWPNQGWTTIARILEAGSLPREGDLSGRPGAFAYSGDRPARWKVEQGIWLQGYWCFDWYDEVIKVAAIDPATKRITLAAPHVYSVRQGNPSPRRYCALNLLEELDQPGEFYIDRKAGLLYFWPPSDIATAHITLSTLDAPIVRLQDASHVTLHGFVVESGLGDGIEVQGGTGCRIEACEARNLRQIGIRVAGGTKHCVEACDIHETGTGGLVLAGGDRKTLTPAGHEARNNHIWHFSIHQLTGAYGLSFEGVGNHAAHNRIHDAPHQAVFVGGNDHIFEFNEVYRVCTETDDCGALYKGRNPSCRGNLIRFNFWHEIGSPMGHGNAAVYFDDGDGGDTVFGNVFYRCGEPGNGPFGTVFSHGGHGIRAENNIFVECKRALGSAPWDEARWRDALRGGQDCFFPEKLLQEVDITKPPYTTRYPELIGYMNPPPGAPRVSYARRNVFVRCGQTTGGNWQSEAAENLVTETDPGFVNAAKGNFQLRQDSDVFKRLPEFIPIPFAQIGLQKDRLRPAGRLPARGR
jgi:hypothetical protein